MSQPQVLKLFFFDRDPGTHGTLQDPKDEARPAEGSEPSPPALLPLSPPHHTRCSEGACGWPSEGVAGKEGRLWGEGGGGLEDEDGREQSVAACGSDD
ncbi:hypothetical protein EYF80_021191 [Liparis tanakae]|uniref:Uncharacterized protein n=1 Tax=Liparis tanakae TaxID=230148 RepID=A0A4Z2HTA7_9TELE|nr:hypothetical protein EYF80_021191 [Liparis tanakae]